MKSVLPLLALTAAFPLHAQPSPAKPAHPWFFTSPAKPTFQGDNGSSWWNGQTKFLPAWPSPGTRLWTAQPSDTVCAIPLRELPVAQDIDPAIVRAPAPIIDRMPQVKVPPPCGDSRAPIVKPR